MNTLIIIDNEVDLDGFASILNDKTARISIFALTSNFLVITKIQNYLQSFVTDTIELIDSASLINDEVNLMQKSIHDWSQELGDFQVENKKLKDWFMLPDQGGSSWWLGMISEKNSVQDDAFFKIAQINAIEKFYRQQRYDVCLLGLADKRQANILKKIMRATTRKIKFLRCVVSNRKSRKHRLMEFFSRMGWLSALFSAAMYWIIWLKDSRAARKALPPLASRINHDNSFMFVTYFPNIDEDAAANGVFRNKYALALQDKLAELKVPVNWLAMPVFYNGHNFAASMRLVNKFLASGNKFFVLQEFFTAKVFRQAFGWWLRQCMLSFKLFRVVKQDILTKRLTHPAALPLLKYLWLQSFVGSSGTRGIIFYLTYIEVFKTFPQLKTCLYFCEMQAWEKALVLAKKKQNPSVKTLAFQHTVVMENYFNYFYNTDEIKATGKPTDFPVPDQLIANGALTYSLLAKSNFPNLSEAEAIRQLYLAHMPAVTSEVRKPVLLVAGSYDRVETKSLITLVYQALRGTKDFEIWFKGSPVNPMERLFNELEIDWQAANFQITQTSIAELLPLVKIALVANTTVAIEAIAAGCALIIPLFADTMQMNPVISTDADYQLVSTPEQLKASVNLLFNRSAAMQKKYFIGDYWHLDATIPRWTNILNLELCSDIL
jgi:surface carbohydrate biosynthesis protein (TIGR04326 family)